jgi:uncharacterized OB-fold protein
VKIYLVTYLTDKNEEKITGIRCKNKGELHKTTRNMGLAVIYWQELINGHKIQ